MKTSDQTNTLDNLPSDMLSVITSFLNNGRDICNLWLSGNKRINTTLGSYGGVIKFQQNDYEITRLPNHHPRYWPPLILKFDKLQELSIKFNDSDVIPDAGTILGLPSSLTRLTLTGHDNLTDSCIPHLPKRLLHLNLCGNKNLTDACIPHLPKGLLHLDLRCNEHLTDSCIPHLPPGLLHLNLQWNKQLTDSCIPHLPKD